MLGSWCLGFCESRKRLSQGKRVPMVSWYLLELRGEWRNLIINMKWSSYRPASKHRAVKRNTQQNSGSPTNWSEWCRLTNNYCFNFNLVHCISLSHIITIRVLKRLEDMMNNTACPRKQNFVITVWTRLFWLNRDLQGHQSRLASKLMFKGCVDWAVQLINHYSLDKYHKNLSSSPLDSDFFMEQPYPALNNWGLDFKKHLILLFQVYCTWIASSVRRLMRAMHGSKLAINGLRK